MFGQRPILFPTDFSKCSLRALATASELSKSCGAELLILHVVESLGPENVTFGEAETQLQPKAYRARLDADLRAVRPTIPDMPVEYILAEGDPTRQIVAVAAERNCGMIVMGTHGRTGLKRLLMGSTTEYVLRHAPCPVVTVKLPADG